MRPHTSGRKMGFGGRPGSARPSTAHGPAKHVAFGRTSGQGFGAFANEAKKPQDRRSSCTGANQKDAPTQRQQADLNRDALEQFDRLNKASEIDDKMSGVFDTSKQAPI